MEVMTIRIQEETARGISHLAKETKRPRAEMVRELMNKAVKAEHVNVLLKRYQYKEITLRTLAADLVIPLWKAEELVQQVSFPYTRDDQQQDLRLLEDA